MREIGCIVLRHVRSPETNAYWIKCCTSIRTVYPDMPIVIIDDGSNPEFLTPVTFPDCKVIDSEFVGRGELLPYYYLVTQKLFAKAMILHDSVFLQAPLDFASVHDVRFLWDFPMQDGQSFDDAAHLMRQHLQWDMPYHRYTTAYRGCFGVQSIISYEFLRALSQTYPIFSLLESVKTRPLRMALERIFAICCYETTRVDPPICGDILNQPFPWGYTFETYCQESTYAGCTLVKVWTGR